MDIQFAAIFAFAIVTGIIIAIIASAGLNKDKKVRTKYDERQKIARGEAYKYGFYAMGIASCVLMLLHSLGFATFLGCFGYFAAFVLGIIVQFSYAVFHDAYVGLNTNLNKYLIFMSVIAIINLTSTIAGFANGEMVVDGALQSPFMNLLCTVLFVVLVIELGIKKLIDKKDA